MICGQCGRADHFMALAYSPGLGRLFCRACATGTQEVLAEFWGYHYYFAYRSPGVGEWCPALDRLEFETRHPFPTPDTLGAVLSPEPHFIRASRRPTQWRPGGEFTEVDSRANWNTNAVRWDATYDDDGDRNRRYQSDEPMLALLGEVQGQAILDVGSGNGYLCRKLARRGARMTGVELSDEFLRLAREREAHEPLGITFVHGSVARMEALAFASFDKAVSNYVLMDVQDYAAAVREVFRGFGSRTSRNLVSPTAVDESSHLPSRKAPCGCPGRASSSWSRREPRVGWLYGQHWPEKASLIVAEGRSSG
jgi:ubiquinone/menaquinone biosynthesis C-methylase UbiE